MRCHLVLRRLDACVLLAITLMTAEVSRASSSTRGATNVRATKHTPKKAVVPPPPLECAARKSSFVMEKTERCRSRVSCGRIRLPRKPPRSITTMGTSAPTINAAKPSMVVRLSATLSRVLMSLAESAHWSLVRSGSLSSAAPGTGTTGVGGASSKAAQCVRRVDNVIARINATAPNLICMHMLISRPPNNMIVYSPPVLMSKITALKQIKMTSAKEYLPMVSSTHRPW
mmetsp:Transcript_21642/g.49533  ORF Transcript_21642/g.49533 Transcript_21642/m.49533 type:complete len:229 (-) Transcript_21642:496-1182(-)